MLWQTEPKPRGGIRLSAGFVVPCEPFMARQVPLGPEWLHELKHDGCRIIARKSGDRLELWTRLGDDVTAQFASIARALRAIPRDFVIDGDAHCALPADGRGPCDLHSIAGRACAVLISSDLLCLDGEDLRGFACEARRARLKAVLPSKDGVRFSESVDGPAGQTLFGEACRRKLDGIVSKRKSSRYRSGPFDAWRKISCNGHRG